jgi:uncharacterized membrane protein YgdD (TMEM256/DUF423 family)
MKKIYSVYVFFLIILFNVGIVFAQGEGTWGQNVLKWVREEFSALLIAAIIILIVFLIFRRAWAQIAGTLILGGVLLFFVNNPKAFESIGKIVSRIIFGSDVEV